MKNSSNSYIKNYLDSYVEFDNPQFAVMLNGKWGGGKTWFIKKYIEDKKKEENKTNKYLYVSLYGISTISEISDAFFKELHPLFASKAAKLGGVLFRGLIKTSIQLDINGDDKKDVSVSSELPKIVEYLGDVKSYTLIFDDLERCKIQLDIVLGYINGLVEHQGCKAIIIANEGEILDGAESKVQHAYKKIKEKLVGRSFTIEPMLEEAINTFILEIKKEKLKDFFQSQAKDVITKVFHLSTYENLRLIKQSLWEFERLYENIGAVNNSFLENTFLLKDLLSIYLAFSFEIKQGSIELGSLSKIREEKIKAYLAKESKKEIPLDKYPFDTIFYPNIWDEFFTKGFISKNDISEILKRQSYFRDANTPAWIKLLYFYELADDEFPIILETVKNDLRNKVYTKPQIILDIYCIFFSLSEDGLYSQSPSEIMKEYKDYFSKIDMKFEDIEDFDETGQSSLKGICRKKETKEFIEMFNFLKKQISKVRDKEANRYVQTSELLKFMEEDIDKFIGMLCPKSEPYYKYYELSLLKNLDAEKFLEIWLNLKPVLRASISRALVDRYTYNPSKNRLNDERSFLKKLKKAIAQEKECKKGKVSYLHLDNLEKQIEDIFKTCEQPKQS